MNRRHFLKYVMATALTTQTALAGSTRPNSRLRRVDPLDAHVRDQLVRKRLHNQSYSQDIFLDPESIPLLQSSLERLKKLQALVGYANFSLLDFDLAVKTARAYPRVGAFTKAELNFLETLFYAQGQQYGFMGEKPITAITGTIQRKSVQKIPFTGNYLYRGRPVERYERIKKEIGNQVILTSGVRSVIKQFLLFLNKAAASNANLSMASRSLAPPGYSFHGVGDFDVGQRGYGIHNFTEHFTRSPVYEKLSRLGYVKFRYERNNDLGVRFEPWHIEVT